MGAGATAARREGAAALLAGGYFDVVKGNEGEIRTLAGETDVSQHGVDSGTSALDIRQRAVLVKALAKRERNVVLMTGVSDVVSDGERTVVVHNGCEMLGEITGSGCALGTTIASYIAVEREDKLLAVVAALLHYEIAGERASVREEVRGPGSFVPAFIDELFCVRKESVAGDGTWMGNARVEVLDV